MELLWQVRPATHADYKHLGWQESGKDESRVFMSKRLVLSTPD